MLYKCYIYSISMLPNGGGGPAQHFIAIKQVFHYKM